MSPLFSTLINFFSLIEGIPQLDKTLGRTGQLFFWGGVWICVMFGDCGSFLES